jgi:hypothetical protein
MFNGMDGHVFNTSIKCFFYAASVFFHQAEGSFASKGDALDALAPF